MADTQDHKVPPTGGWGLGIDRLAMVSSFAPNMLPVKLTRRPSSSSRTTTPSEKCWRSHSSGPKRSKATRTSLLLKLWMSSLYPRKGSVRLLLFPVMLPRRLISKLTMTWHSAQIDRGKISRAFRRQAVPEGGLLNGDPARSLLELGVGIPSP
jgi:hypothetical protein